MIRQDKRKNKNKRRVFIFVVIVLVLIFLMNVFNIEFPKTVSRSVAWPFVKAGDMLSEPLSGFISYFNSKNSLSKENEELKQKVSALELSLLKEKIRSQEDLEIQEEKDNSPEGEQFKVLTRPPFSPYDTLIVELEDKSIFIDKGVFVSGVFIGNVSEIYGNGTAVIKLRSSSGEKTVVRISEVDAEAIGKGGGRYLVTIPKDVDVSLNQIITVPGIGNEVIGVVTKIDDSGSGSFKDIHFSTPVSLSKITFVTVSNKDFQIVDVVVEEESIEEVESE